MYVAVGYIEELRWSGRMLGLTLAAEHIHPALTSSNLGVLGGMSNHNLGVFIEALASSHPDRFAGSEASMLNRRYRSIRTSG